ncbi:MAG: prephenate dehydratase [Halobacteriaceae archaeon]
MTTVTLGPAGTYSHRAARAVADDVTFVDGVQDVIAAVAAGDADRGVVPIENSIEGSVTASQDALLEYDVAIGRELVTPIEHALLAQDRGFDVIASHEQALAQCHDFLEAEYPDVSVEPVASTARGVERARADESVAGIAHPDLADSELTVIADAIQDRPANATRFFLVVPAAQRARAGGKTTLIVYPDTDYPGLLVRLLEPFADRDIDLTRVESRPSGDRLGDYVFHLDLAAGLYEDRTQAALATVESVADDGWVQVLGSYDVEHVL